MAAHQSPMIWIPKKSTDEVDWTTPIRTSIAQSYGDNPDNYVAECSSLQRCRQDAVRGAGSDITARDLLYKYFGQLELLELRFSEIRVNFPWRDAFTNKLIVQTSIAYEKASILFQMAATHSAIAASQSRSDPEGQKRAFHYFRTCAGMLTYINENFLHAPSTDLGREVVKFLINIILAQATEVFLEKCNDEKKSNALISKIASQAGYMYTALAEDVKEFMGKGIFDRSWVTLVQIKAKFFSSVSQYCRGLADVASGKHGDALTRFIQAESLAKEALRSAQSFSSSFVTSVSQNLPTDAGASIQDQTKAHYTICVDKKNEAEKDNDLIYNAICPAFEALPIVEKTVVATPIPIQEVYGSVDVQKTIGQAFFLRLVPLSVHESASVYSEEKAKLVRAEVEKAEQAEGEARSAIDGLGVKEGLIRYKAMGDGAVSGSDEVPLEVQRWRDDITVTEDGESVHALIRELTRLKDDVNKELEAISRDLEIESKDCEMMRVKYEHLWAQAPSATLTKKQRQDLKSNYGALEAAAISDRQVTTLWNSIRQDIELLLKPQLEELFSERGGSKPENLLDLDVGSDADDTAERAKIKGYVDEIEERLKRLNMISRERGEVLKDLKEKIQADDVSHLLLINQRNPGAERSLFNAELEKFVPYQQRLASTVHHQGVALQEVATLWKGLKDFAGRGPGARKWDEREKKKRDTVKRFSRARDGYMEVRDGLAKGLQFYTDLSEITSKLRSDVRSYVAERTNEREALVVNLETKKRLSASSASSPPPPLASKPPRPPPPPSSSALDSAFSSMNLRDQTPSRSPQSSHRSSWSQVSSPPPPPPSSQQYTYGPSVSTQAPSPYTNNFPPPPPQAPPSRQQSSFSYSSYGIPRYISSSHPPQSPQQQPQAQAPFIPPPPPQLTTQSSYATPPSAPPDPYAGLAMFNPSAMRPASQHGYNSNSHLSQSAQYQPPPPTYGGLPTPPPQPKYAYPPQQPGGLPPPPPPPGGIYGHPGYGS